MEIDDRPEYAIRLEKAREGRGFDNARKAAKRFGWVYDTYVQHENGTRGITRAAKAYARAYRVSEAWLLTGEGQSVFEVPLMGKVGAGEFIDLLNNDDFGEIVEAPHNATTETIAVQVSGESMLPAYEEGTLLYYSENLPPENLVNRRCIVKLADGRIFVKTLRHGKPGYWNLESLNSGTATMIDQVVEWAAKIDWVKPL